MSQTRKFIFAAGSNYLRMIATMVGMFFLTRGMALRWGVDDFGRWSLITTVMGFALLLDLGLGNVVLKTAGSRDSESASAILSSVFVGFFVLSVAATVVLSAALFWMLPNCGTQVKIAIVLMGFRATVGTLPWTVFRSTLYARNEMSATNLMQSLGILLYAGVACWALYYGAGMGAISAVSLASAILDSALLVLMVRRFFPDLKFRFRFSFAVLRPMLSLGGASMAVNLAGFILLKTDPIIVKGFLPIAQVAIYAVALRIAENIFLLCKQLVNALTPHAIRAGASGRKSDMAFMYQRATRYVLAFGGAVYVTALALGKSAVCLWLSKDYESSAGILNILLLAMVLSIPQLVGSNLMTFSGDHKRIAKYVSIGAGINVFASVILVQILGASGVAYGTLLTTVLIDVSIMIPVACRSFQMSLVRLIYDLCRAVALPGVIQFLFLMYLGKHFVPVSLAGVFAQALAGGAVFGILFVVFGMTRDEIKMFANIHRSSPYEVTSPPPEEVL